MKVKRVLSSSGELVPEDTVAYRIYSALPPLLNGSKTSIPDGFVPVSDKLVGMPGSINDAVLIQRGDTAEEAHGEILAWDGQASAAFDPKEAAYLKLECEGRVRREMAADAERAAERERVIDRMAESMAGSAARNMAKS